MIDVEKLKQIGSEWIKNDIHRIYFNNIFELQSPSFLYPNEVPLTCLFLWGLQAGEFLFFMVSGFSFFIQTNLYFSFLYYFTLQNLYILLESIVYCSRGICPEIIGDG